jgi:chemotaxis protein methyltransferase CheR
MTHPTLTPSEFRRFQSFIYGHAGIHLSAQKNALLTSRLWRRLRALNLDRYGDYLDRVETSPDELVQMLDCITTNETRFFREAKQFEFLETVFAERLRRDATEGRRSSVVRAWSAGCSTGQEPYSVAMSLRASLGEQWDAHILATDLSTRALDVARAGTWPIEQAQQIPPNFLKAFMLRGHGSQAGQMKAGREIRSMLSFGRLNLNDAGYGMTERFDVILCRNVLIYFDAGSRRAVVERLVERLLPGGVLMVGHAESLHGVSTALRPLLPTIYELDSRKVS